MNAGLIPVPGKLLIEFKEGVTESDKKKFLEYYGLVQLKGPKSITVVAVPLGTEEYWLRQLLQNELVEKAQQAVDIDRTVFRKHALVSEGS